MAYKNAITKAKRNSFSKFCEEIEAEAPRRYKALAQDSAISPVCVKKKDASYTENEEDRIHLFLRTHLPESYPTVKANDILPITDTPIMKRGEKTENSKLALPGS